MIFLLHSVRRILPFTHDLGWTFHRAQCVTLSSRRFGCFQDDGIVPDNKWAPFPTYPVVLGIKGMDTPKIRRNEG